MSEQDKLAQARRKLLEKRLKGKSITQSAPIISQRPENSLPLASAGQERLWVLQQLQPQSSAYNMSNAVQIKGELDSKRLENSIQVVVKRHSALRTNFLMQDGELVQAIHNDLHISLTQEKISAEKVTEHIQAIVEKPFNLAQDALIRAVLLEIDSDYHVFVLVIHHIVSDEWSLDLFWKEVSTLYANNADNLSNLPIHYADYAHWQREQSYDKQLAYWQETLAGDLPLLQLPSDNPRPAVQTFTGNLITLELDPDLSQALDKFRNQAKTTLFMTLLATFKVLLYRYTGQADILIGTPIANRKQAEVENLIGFFLNTVVIRSDFSENISFTDYLEQIRQQSLSAISNSDVPFDRVVDALKPQRDPSYNPIFQAMFVYQDNQVHQVSLGDLSLNPITIDAQVSKFDVTLFARETDNSIEIGLEYNSDLFDAEQMTRFLGYFQELVQNIVDNPASNISDLNLLSDDERQHIFELSQSESYDYPQDSLIQDLISVHPSASPAIQDEYGTSTYGELNQRANQVAHYLRSLGVDTDMPVGLCVERSADMLVGILGILKAGGAYVPIDPDYPEDRIQYMLDDAGMSILLIQDMLTAQFSNTKATLIALDTNPRLDLQPTSAPEIETSPDNLAYIIYTSGSTGKPKGVRISHRNLVHSTTARYQFYPNQAERFLLLSSYAFDSSIVGIFWTLCAGGTLCLPPHQGERDVSNIARLIDTYQVTHLLVIPSLYQILLDFADPSELQSLNTVMVAGEACPITLVKAHYDALPNCKLYNEYGPTEGTVWSTAWEIPANAQTILIGKPIPNMQAYVLDKHLNPVPIGVRGELFIAGDGIAQGYNNRPELTAERFIDNSFAEGRLYRTGDLAQFRDDGNIEFFGRADFQVKISGYRIELGEIESSILQYQAIREAIVLPVPNQTKASDDTINLDDIIAQINTQNAENILADIETMSDEDVINILNTLTGDSL